MPDLFARRAPKLVLVGPSGAGKTSLARSLAGEFSSTPPEPTLMVERLRFAPEWGGKRNGIVVDTPGGEALAAWHAAISKDKALLTCLLVDFERLAEDETYLTRVDRDAQHVRFLAGSRKTALILTHTNPAAKSTQSPTLHDFARLLASRLRTSQITAGSLVDDVESVQICTDIRGWLA